MKARDIRALKPDERKDQLKDARQTLMHERGVAAMGGAMRNPGKIGALRKTIARILTIENQEGRRSR